MVLGFDNPFAHPIGSFNVPVLPPTTDPDDSPQTTICFSSEWLPFVLGALSQLTLQSTWLGEPEDVLLAQNRAQLLLSMISESVGCAPAYAFAIRYDEATDTIQTSIDGGITWEDSPQSDPRHQVLLPPLDTADPRCDAAANAIATLMQIVDAIKTALAGGSLAGGIGSAIILIMALFGAFALLLAIAVAIGEIALIIGLANINAAFTPAVWDTLTCILYCRMDSTGLVTPAALTAIRDDVDNEIGGDAATLLQVIFDLTGEAGLTNAARAGDATGDCSGCTDCGWCFTWDLTAFSGDWFATKPNSNYGGAAGTWIPGQGWSPVATGNLAGSQDRNNTLVIQHLVGGTVTDIDVLYDRSAGQYSPANEAFRLAYDGNFDTPGTNLATGASPGASGTDLHLTWSGSQAMDAIGVFIRTSFRAPGTTYPSPMGSAVVKRITLRGVGANPFGADNCP